MFPHTQGKIAYEYLDQALKNKAGYRNCISVRDVKGGINFIYLDEIISLEAFDRHTLIHTTGTDIYVRKLLSRLEEEIRSAGGDQFIRIHRSFLVNKYFIRQIRPYEVVAADKYVYSVSKQKYRAIKEVIAGREER